MLIIRRRKRIKIGQISGFYMLWYGIGRYMIEMLRTDALMYGGLKVAQLVSILLMVVGFILIIRGLFVHDVDNNYNN